MDEVWADTEPLPLDEEGDSVVRIDYSPACESGAVACLRALAPRATATGRGLAQPASARGNFVACFASLWATRGAEGLPRPRRATALNFAPGSRG